MGIYYNEYKFNRYYWEFVKIFIKIIIIIIVNIYDAEILPNNSDNT